MKSKACINCGCVNWENSTHCLRCKFDLSQSLPAFEGNSYNQRPIIQERQINYDSGFNPFRWFKILGYLSLLLLAGFIYVNNYSYDKFSGISTFDQYYYRIPPPTEDDLRNAIIKLQRNKVERTVKDTVYTKSMQCPNTPGTPFGYGCTPASDSSAAYSQKYVEYTPNLISFEVENGTIIKDADGKTIYFAKYKGVIKGRKFGVQDVVEDSIDRTDSERALLIEGGVSLIWNKSSYSWSVPLSIKEELNLPKK